MQKIFLDKTKNMEIKKPAEAGFNIIKQMG
ncbi:hypothetical protein HNQ88_000645 [Aureibacter tunicatorum]|uniref:Uncharacterized protein n=1 Tax=Aureibacter tunicatorum TaxID=866807 RepID=A0AAE4BP77_9BACT|nr:hypothetical protein [Aureibacter tunicatorum]BDD02704.1 hypothetical protein AUTU_01870 [Aureibacter tunicatorum]